MFKLEKQRAYLFDSKEELNEFVSSILLVKLEFDRNKTQGSNYCERKKITDWADDISNYYNNSIIEFKRKEEYKNMICFNNTYLLILIDNEYEKEFNELFDTLLK
jgi:hypothetical protein